MTQVRVESPVLVAGPMGRVYINRPCGHGRWSLRCGEVKAVRRCAYCGERRMVHLTDDLERAVMTWLA